MKYSIWFVESSTQNINLKRKREQMGNSKANDDLFEMLKSDTAKSAVSAFNQGYKLGYELGFNQGQLFGGPHE